MKHPDKYLNVGDFRRAAQQALPEPVFAFLEGGSDDEVTLERNGDAFSLWSLLPRVLTDVSRVDPSCRIMGQELAWPFIVGPTGMSGLIHPDGEVGLARAAADAGAFYTLSTMATRSIEEVAAATNSPKLFQLYVFRDRGLTRELIERAKRAGYAGLVLTVDIQVAANRERDKRAGMVIPPKLSPNTILAMARRPRWCLNNLRFPMRLANFSQSMADPGVSLLSFISSQFDPSVTWKDLEWVAKQWGGPIAIKGILSSHDSLHAIETGATTIILSNHGGRQLDGAAAPLDVLEGIVEKARGRAEIVLDGGIRRGTDMLKALALGANACMGGRVGLYGLATDGYAGARRVFELLRTEFERDMALAGRHSVDAIQRNCVMRLSETCGRYHASPSSRPLFQDR